MEKVGIMGGTFNPIHYGHLFLAENALEQLELDRILFMPSNNPPHKNKAELASNQDRAQMIRLAIQGNPCFELSELEYEREGITYTADTLTILKEQYPETEYYFILGADSLLSLQDWKEPKTIFKLCTILAAGRDQVPAKEIEEQIEFLKETYGARIIHFKMPMIEISSAEIRTKASVKRSIRYFVPDLVRYYIEQHGLYDI